MRPFTQAGAAVVAATFLLLCACSVQQGQAADPTNNPTGNTQTDTKAAAVDSGADPGAADAGGTATADAGGPADPHGAGTPCTDNDGCTSGVCYRGACADSCSSELDCAIDQDCSSDDGKRLLCVDPVYDVAVGASCAAVGSCAGDLKCNAAKEVASAVCTAACTDDTDCPMDMACTQKTKGKTYCAKRKFCGGCMHTGNCAPGGACVKMASGRFCTTPCTPGSTECPRYAACQDIGDGNFQCIHKSGDCSATGTQCDPCTVDEQCNTSSQCMSFFFSKESFCADDCTSKECPTGYMCIPTSQTGKSCIPNYKPPTLPTCTKSLSPNMEVGDIINDYAMVGLTDTDGDYNLLDEQLRLFRFSHFAKHHKLIYFNVSAGWCVACQAETKHFAAINHKYYPKGVVIFQVLYDGFTKGKWTYPSEKVLKNWIQWFKPQGIIGVDPERNCIPYNTKGGTPLNMIIDAKTGMVLEKWNGYGQGKAEYLFEKHLANM